MALSGMNLYQMPTGELEKLAELACSEVGIARARRLEVNAFLKPLKIKGALVLPHYDHSLRVGIIMRLMAPWLLLNERAAVYAGLLHDIGKALADPRILGKTGEWTAEDYAHIKGHVERSYEMLRGKFDYTADIIKVHHFYQQNGYPEVLPPLLHDYCQGEQLNIMYHGRMLAMADVYDALHRGNARFGGTLSGVQIREKMMQFNPDQQSKVELLYSKGVFTYDVAS